MRSRGQNRFARILGRHDDLLEVPQAERVPRVAPAGDALEPVVPAVALDELVIKREAIGDPTIDASIRFTLYLNGS